MLCVATIDGKVYKGRVISTHPPQGKRTLAYTVQVIETEKAHLVESANVVFENQTDPRPVIGRTGRVSSTTG